MPRRDDPFQVIQIINDNACKLKLSSEYNNIYPTFDVSNLSLFDICEEDTNLRMNPFDERGNEMN